MKAKSLPKLKAEAQKVFNSYIRKRDEGKPCISCGEKRTLQAGHFYAVGGYDALRYNEDNVNGECAGCNCFSESHLILYGLNLEYRIGFERVQKLHELAKDYKMNGYKWSKPEVMEIIETYKQKLKEWKDQTKEQQD